MATIILEGGLALELSTGARSALNTWPSKTVCMVLFGGALHPDSCIRLTSVQAEMLLREIAQAVRHRPQLSYWDFGRRKLVTGREFLEILTEWQKSGLPVAA